VNPALFVREEHGFDSSYNCAIGTLSSTVHVDESITANLVFIYQEIGWAQVSGLR